MLTALLWASTSSVATAHELHRSETRAQRSPEAGTHTTDESAANVVTARSAEDHLRELPGVYLQRHAAESKGLQFFVRGFDAQHGTDVELRVDGIPVNQSGHVHGHGYLDLVWLPSFMVHGAQFHGGTYAIDQGAFATAGTIDISLRSAGDERSGGVRAPTELRLQGTSRGRGALGLWTELVEEGRRASAGVEVIHDRGVGERRVATRFSSLMQLRYETRPASEHTLTLAMGHAAFQVPTLLRVSEVEAGLVGPFTSYEDDLSGSSTGVRLAWGWATRRRLRTRITHRVWFDTRSFTYEDNNTGALVSTQSDLLDQEETRFVLGTRQDIQRALHRNHRLHVHTGGALTWMRHASLRRYPTGVAPVDNSVRIHGISRGDSSVHPATSNHGDKLWISSTQHPLDRSADRALTMREATVNAGVAWIWMPRDWVRTEAGLRVDLRALSASEHVLDRTEGSLSVIASPRFRARFTLSEHVQVQAGVGRGFRPHEANARFTTNLSTDDRAFSTTSTSADVGLHLHTETLQARFSTYGIWVSDEAIYDHISGQTWLMNPSRRLGGEFSLDWTPRDWLRLSAQGSGFHGVFPQSGARVVGAPRFVGQGSVEVHPHRTVLLAIRGRIVGKRDLRYSGVAGDYALFDMHTQWDFSTRGSMGFSVENLWNQRYTEAVYHYASHWNPNESPSVLPRLHALYGAPRTFWFTLSFSPSSQH